MGPTVRILVHLAVAVAAGGTIGMERSFHGRAAGFRTHALVCLASSALMTLPAYSTLWVGGSAETLRLDPTRMAQGIMTGIGFLGAGVIFRDGLTVRGLTTAASIWVTAGIGVLAGVGLWVPTATATVATLGVLSVFRRIEAAAPSQHFARFRLRFERAGAPGEDEVVAMLSADGLAVFGLSYCLLHGGTTFQYAGTVRGRSAADFGRLAARLRAAPTVRGFLVEPY